MRIFSQIVLVLFLFPDLNSVQGKVNYGQIKEVNDGITKKVEASFLKENLEKREIGDTTDLIFLDTSGVAKSGVGITGAGADVKVSTSLFTFSQGKNEFLNDVKFLGSGTGAEAGIGPMGANLKAGAEIVIVEVDTKLTKTKFGFCLNTAITLGRKGWEVKVGGLGVIFGETMGISTPFGEISIKLGGIVNLLKGDGCYKENEEQSGLLCYPKCRYGYTGVGPVCWQDCPSGYRNDGMFCYKPAPYGRGAGYPWKFGDGFDNDGMLSRCRRDHGSCEMNGLIAYPRCRSNYHQVGCCICSPDCPSGMTDIGISCAKNSYGRSSGTFRGNRDEL